MKIYFTFILSIGIIACSYSQAILVNETRNDVPYVSSEDIVERFETTIQEDYGLVYVDLSLTEVSETKMAGIDNKTALLADFTVRVYSLIDDSKLGYKTFKLSGSGRTIDKARQSVVRSISRTRRKINDFLAETMAQVKTTDCGSIGKMVDNYINTLQYKKAYALASSRVEGCEDNMWVVRQKVYDSYQNEYCERHINKVNAYLSSKNYEKAIKEIQNVSPTSRCNNQIKTVIATIKNDYQKDYDQSFTAYMNSLELQVLEEKERRRIMDMLLLNNILND